MTTQPLPPRDETTQDGTTQDATTQDATISDALAECSFTRIAVRPWWARAPSASVRSWAPMRMDWLTTIPKVFPSTIGSR